MTRIKTTLVVLLALVSLGGFLAGTAVAPPYPPLPVDPFWLVWAGFPVVGALIVVKRPRNHVGIIQLGIGVSAAVSAFTSVAYELGVDPQWPVLINQLAFIPVFLLLPLLILVFPSGGLPSERWRPYIWVAAITCCLLALWFAVRPVDYSFDGVVSYANPIGIGALASYDAWVIGVFQAALVSFAAAVLVQAIIAYRRADRIRRLQVKWVVVPAVFMPLLFLVGSQLEEVGSGSLELSNLVTMAGILVGGNGIAVGIGIAVFRHNLYGIDKIVSRTVSYSLLLVLLGLAFIGLVTGLTTFLSTDDPLVIAVATLTVAALFNPVRRRIHRAVDRRFNRSKYDAEVLMGEFAESLQGQVEGEDVLDGWVHVVDVTMQPAAIGVWVRS